MKKISIEITDQLARHLEALRQSHQILTGGYVSTSAVIRKLLIEQSKYLDIELLSIKRSPAVAEALQVKPQKPKDYFASPDTQG